MTNIVTIVMSVVTLAVDTRIQRVGNMNSIQFEQQTLQPSKIVCVGRNYVAHIEELGNEVPQQMVLFCKPNSAIGSHLKAFDQEALHYEGELCFMVQGGRFAAVGFGLDLTKRGLQSELKTKGLPWERAKAFDGAVLFSEFVAIDDIPRQLNFTLHINQEMRQQGNLQLMIYKPDQVLKEIQSFMTLADGDIVMTGTPKGVGEVKAGDLFEAEVRDGEQLLLRKNWQAV